MMEHHEKGTILHIRVRPRAKERSIRITEDLSECLVSIKTAPIRGKANREVVKFVAKKLGVSSHQVMIISGISSQRKILLINGMKPAEVLTALHS